MSRLGKQPIIVPQGVDVTFENPLVTVKGPKGTLQQIIHRNMDVIKEEGKILLKPKSADPAMNKFWGLAYALIRNMVQGVSQGTEKTLEFNGVGYKAAVKDGTLEMSLGFSHLVVVKAPAGVEFKVEKNKITVGGIDKALVGQVAAKVRNYKPPEPYKGKGIFYKDEKIKRKAGKKAATG